MSGAREARLGALQGALVAVAEGLDDGALRVQYHAELSPVGWHLRHCAFVEALWIRDRLLGDDRLTAPLRAHCLPELAAKAERGTALPERPALLAWCREVMAENLALLVERASSPASHPLLAGGYLWDFLINHHAQHLETMRVTLCERARAASPAHHVARPLAPAPPRFEARAIAAGEHAIGGGNGFAFDNEAPAQRLELAAFAIAARPVSCAQYLAFMEAGGYDDRALWSAAGWDWRQRSGVECPHGWARDVAGHWHGNGRHGPCDLDAQAPVTGLSRHEAGAFAAFAGARLPHEYQWEAAARAGALDAVGGAWEWCANAFHPYPGFRARPYREYSLPWFDGRHFTLRGAGPHSESDIRRPAFRNYYQAHCRHIHAGARLLLSQALPAAR